MKLPLDTPEKQDFFITMATLIAIMVFMVLIANNLTGGVLLSKVRLIRFSSSSADTKAQSTLAVQNQAPDPAPQFTDLVPRLMDAYVETDGKGDAGGGSTGTTGDILGSGGALGSGSDDLQRSLPACLANKQVYDIGEKYGVPWYILAGIHYREGHCNNTVSLTSGRGIGDTEPDIVINGGCSGGQIGPGVPVPRAEGGCKFNSLEDSAIYASNLLRGKVGDKPLNDEAIAAEAVAGYNGWGNLNCSADGTPRDGVPYKFCPPRYAGDDHPYVYNKYDTDRHGEMYLVYCSDGVKCVPPQLDVRIGVFTAAKIIKQAYESGAAGTTQPPKM